MASAGPLRWRRGLMFEPCRNKLMGGGEATIHDMSARPRGQRQLVPQGTAQHKCRIVEPCHAEQRYQCNAMLNFTH